MVTRDRRRAAVVRLVGRFGVSERRACAVVGQHRSTQRRPPAARADADAAYGEWLCGFAQSHPRWGWRKAHDVAAREGLVTNPKRTLRLWRAHHLRRPAPSAASGSASATAPPPGCGRSVPTTYGRWTSSSTRPPLAGASSCSTSSTSTPAKRSRSTSATASTPTGSSRSSKGSPPSGAPPRICACTTAPSSSPERCATGAARAGTNTAYIEPGAPWENGWIESFNGRLRDECLNIEDFANLLEARVVIEDWRHDYNHHRPHRSLGGQTPAAYAANHRTGQPTITTDQHP